MYPPPTPLQALSQSCNGTEGHVGPIKEAIKTFNFSQKKNTNLIMKLQSRTYHQTPR